MGKSDSLRKRAEKELKDGKNKESIPETTPELVHELQVHQAELEIQNEELMQSQQEYADLYNKYFDLYNDVPVGYFSLDKEGIIRNVNDKGVELLQIDKDRIMGRGFSRFIPKSEEHKYIIGLINSADTCENQELELQLQRDEKVFDAHMEIKPVFDRNGSRYRIIIADISERKKADEALKQSRDDLEEKVKERTIELESAFNESKANEEKFRGLFNNAEDMITLGETLDNGIPGKFIEVNEEATRRLGYSREELLNMTPFDILQVNIDEAPRDAFKITENGNATFETIHVAKDGSKIPVEVKTLQLNLNGKDVILGISRDITERKKAEVELKQAYNELGETVQELERSNEELQQFAYVSSHDLQEPLRTIASFTQLLERRYKGQLDNDADEFMDYIVDASVRMKDQITGLLEYSRVQTKVEKLEPVEMNLVLNQTIQNLNVSIRETDAEIINEELPIVIGDARQLQRVFQNLISNAIRFRKCEEPLKIYITAHESEDGKENVFSVQDNGIGIETQYFDRIFTIFQQLHTREEYNGTGIGLSIVKRIIERHSGHIWVKSEFGVGSTFYFTIPIRDDVVEEWECCP